MKKTLLTSLFIALSSHAMTANIPYYMQNPNSSNIDAIKTDSASCGCKAGCNGELNVTHIISLIKSYDQIKAEKDATAKERSECTYYTENADHSKANAINKKS